MKIFLLLLSFVFWQNTFGQSFFQKLSLPNDIVEFRSVKVQGQKLFTVGSKGDSLLFCRFDLNGNIEWVKAYNPSKKKIAVSAVLETLSENRLIFCGTWKNSNNWSDTNTFL